jgi:hypothetical protein
MDTFLIAGAIAGAAALVVWVALLLIRRARGREAEAGGVDVGAEGTAAGGAGDPASPPAAPWGEGLDVGGVGAEGEIR